jgi:hypothetical protein
MDVRKLLKITDMYAKVDWKDYFGEDASESIKKYLQTASSISIDSL